MAQDQWRTTLDRIGLMAYFTIVSGELPDSRLLAYASGEADEQEWDEPATEEDLPDGEPERIPTAA